METSGTVRNLKISEGRGFVELETSDGGIETFIIWYENNSRGPAALYTSQLSVAMVNGLKVRILHGDAHAYIEDLIVWAPGL